MSRPYCLSAGLLMPSVLLLWSTAAAGATFFGPVPYRAASDTPAGFATGPSCIEDFEDGEADPRLLFPLPGSIIGPGGLTDSVDADDGVIDGSGTFGHSFFRSPPAEIAFAEPLPTFAGLVWTDGGAGTAVSFEAFGADGASLGVIGPFTLGDASNTGDTAEDRFFGVREAAGISALRITHSSGGLELDHIQFSGTCPLFGDGFEPQ